MKQQTPDTLTVFFDGNCPLCLAEIHLLKNNNQHKRLRFVDLHDTKSVEGRVNCALAMQVIHAQLDSGEIIKGPKVFEEAYKRSDLYLMKRLFSFKPFQRLYAVFYRIFARFRHVISKAIGPTLLSMAKRKYPD